MASRTQFDSPSGEQQVYQPPPASQFNGNRLPQNSINGGFSAYANTNGATNGMGNMLERMHGVTDRSMVPQKRRKMNEEQENQRKAEFSGGGGKGGPIGEYMREKRKQGQQEGMANGTTVPVSLVDDDEEVQVVGDSGDKEVCYGRIEGVQINAFKVPTPKQGARAVSDAFWPQVGQFLFICLWTLVILEIVFEE